MLLFGKYEVGRLLGCGAFAKVYYARNISNGQSVAIKVINKKKIALSPNLMGNIKREISIMKRLKHPNIVQLYEVLANKSKIYFVLEYVKGGELFAKVAKGRFSEDLARKYFRQLVSAVRYCHTRGVYHRDLKPENLLVDQNGDLKVSDFGLSAASIGVENDKDDLLRTLCGTPAYVAPEILSKKGYHGADVDVWSCGVVLFVLTAGYLPFNDPNLMAMYKKIYKGEFKCPKWMSSDLKRLLSRLLDINPATRITIHEITHHPWFTKSVVGGSSSSSGSFTFSFHDDYFFDEYEDKEKEKLQLDVGDKDSESGMSRASSSCSLNAFDLISFSSGLDLSGLFDETFNPVVDDDKFVSAEPPHKILDTLEQIANASGYLQLKRRKECGVDLQGGANGNFVVRVEITPLTDNLVVVEVKKKAGDSATYNRIWKNKVKPQLAGLIHGETTELVPDPDPEESVPIVPMAQDHPTQLAA